MKKMFCLTLLLIGYHFNSSAQFYFGPTIGLNQYLIFFKPLSHNPFEHAAKVSFGYGLKTETLLSKHLFLSTQNRFSYNKHDFHLDPIGTKDSSEDAWEKYNHIQSSLLINASLSKKISLGFGVNHLHTYSKDAYIKNGFLNLDTVQKVILKENDWGGIIALSKAINQFVVEINYTFATSNNNHSEVRRYIQSIQLNISYLFKTNLRIGKKGNRCPRF